MSRKPLAAFYSEVEAGKVLQFFGRPEDVVLLCKLSTGRYACISEQQGELRSAEKVDMSYTDFLRGVEEVFGDDLVQMASWEVNTEELRKCSECEIPARDGELEAGMCFDCYYQCRTEHPDVAAFNALLGDLEVDL